MAKRYYNHYVNHDSGEILVPYWFRLHDHMGIQLQVSHNSNLVCNHWTEWSTGSNQASNFKMAGGTALG